MAPPRTLDVSWGFDLTATTQDKSSTRPGVKAQARSWELVGVDGSVRGGLRPMPPLVRVRVLHPEDADWPPDGETPVENPYLTDTHLTSVTDFRPVTVGIGSRWHAHGFVYRAVRSGGETADLFLEMWDSVAEDWQTVLLAADVDAEAPMDARAHGRFVHAFVQGESAIVAYTGLDDPDTPTTVTWTVIRPSGPGSKPNAALRGLVTGSDEWFFVDEEDTAQQLDGRPAQVRMALFSGAVTGRFPGTEAYDTGDDHEDETALLDPGSYAVVVQFEDTRSGRRGQPSDSVEIKKEDFDDASRYLAIEGIYDDTRYDRMLVWRSVRTQDVGGTFTAGVLILERVVVLEEYERDSDPYDGSAVDVSHFLYVVSLRDLVLANRADRVLTDSLVGLDTVPPAGNAIVHDSTLVVSGIRGMPDPSEEKVVEGDLLRNVGEVRWSSVTEVLLEAFPPNNRWLPPTPRDEVVRFESAGDSLIGFSRGRVYVLRKDNGFMRVYATHVGYGICAERAAASLGGGVYYATTDGVKAIYANAQLDDVESLDGLFNNEGWGDDALSMAFDSRLSAMVLLNATTGRAVLLWAGTGMTTELAWLPFAAVESGKWPAIDSAGDSDMGGALEDRALFLYSRPDAGVTGEEDLLSAPAVYAIADRMDRGRLVSGPMEEVAVIDSIGAITPPDAAYRLVTLTGGGLCDPSQMVGMVLSVVASSEAGRVGTGFRVTATDGETSEPQLVITKLDAGDDWPEADDEVVVGGPYFRWVGRNLQGDSDSPADQMLRVKQMNGLRAAFAGVEGEPEGGELEKRVWIGQAWRGTEPRPTSEDLPRNGRGEVIESVIEGASVEQPALGRVTGRRGVFGVQGTSLSAGVVVVCPDLDFRLLAVSVEGRLVGSDTTQMESTA